MRKILRAPDHTIGLRHHNSRFGAEFVFFVLLAFADTAHFGLMEAVNFVFRPALLIDGLALKRKIVTMNG